MEITARELLSNPDRLVRNVNDAVIKIDAIITEVRATGRMDDEAHHMLDASNATKTMFIGLLVASTSLNAFAGGYMGIHHTLHDLTNNPLLPDPVAKIFLTAVEALEQD